MSRPHVDVGELRVGFGECRMRVGLSVTQTWADGTPLAWVQCPGCELLDHLRERQAHDFARSHWSTCADLRRLEHINRLTRSLLLTLEPLREDVQAFLTAVAQQRRRADLPALTLTLRPKD